MTVEAVTDQPTYASGQNPQLSIRLTNNGETDCTLNVGTTHAGLHDHERQRHVVALDGLPERAERHGRAARRRPDGASAAPLTWDRTRSSVGTCADADRPRAPGGGATYHLAVEIGGIASTESAQLLLY